MDEKEAKYLLDAAEACRSIIEFVEDKSISDYKQDKLLRSAVERQFEILGEALNTLDDLAPRYRWEYPEIGNIIGMRNRIIHGYDTVDDDIVWDAIKNHIPGVMDWLEGMSI